MNLSVTSAKRILEYAQVKHFLAILGAKNEQGLASLIKLSTIEAYLILEALMLSNVSATSLYLSCNSLLSVMNWSVTSAKHVKLRLSSSTYSFFYSYFPLITTCSAINKKAAKQVQITLQTDNG
jgi:hypothetical protein